MAELAHRSGYSRDRAIGEVGKRFAEAFAARAQAGVSVKLLLDAVGAASIGREIAGILNESGCQLRWFHPVRWYNLHRVNNRNHRKSLIIDGRIAFTGGAGSEDHWRGRARRPGEWRDLQMRLEGPGVVTLQTGFAFNWLETTGEVISGPRYYPVIEPAGNVELQTVVSSPKGDVYRAIWPVAWECMPCTPRQESCMEAHTATCCCRGFRSPGPATWILRISGVKSAVFCERICGSTAGVCTSSICTWVRKRYPALLPLLHLDYIYFEHTLRARDAFFHSSRLALVASSHLPLVADFVL
ncbi:MAG: hypothetical protein HY235_23930 [Acidobacteria bacterium]|nr:hypothetical protein [Acidobacteriota bacterium]